MATICRARQREWRSVVSRALGGQAPPSRSWARAARYLTRLAPEASGLVTPPHVNLLCLLPGHLAAPPCGVCHFPCRGRAPGPGHAHSPQPGPGETQGCGETFRPRTVCPPLGHSFQAGRGLTQDRPSADAWGVSGLTGSSSAGPGAARSHCSPPPGDPACSAPPGLSCDTEGPGKENAQVPPN